MLRDRIRKQTRRDDKASNAQKRGPQARTRHMKQDFTDNATTGKLRVTTPCVSLEAQKQDKLCTRLRILADNGTQRLAHNYICRQDREKCIPRRQTEQERSNEKGKP